MPLLMFSENFLRINNLIIEQPSVELIHDRFYIIKLSLLIIYILIAIASVYAFLIRHKYKKYGKYQSYRGENAVFASQISRLVSVILFLTTCVIYIQNSGGITYMAGALIGILQMICMAVCTVSAIISIINLIKEKSHLYHYIFNIFCSIIMIAAAGYFEMYRFWKI